MFFFFELLELVCQILLAGPAALRVVREARSGRNQASNDDVLLQATQVILQATNRCFCENTRGFLEGSRRNEGFRCE